jgi:DNA-binding winged helix-turn-helix (wHTH) protein
MPEDLVQFEDFVLNRGAYELRRGDVLVPLQRIPLDLLCLLVERHGKLVKREEILERVWGKGVFVDSETSINTAIRKVRRALDDNPHTPRFVLTVPAKGYRFVAAVRETNHQPWQRAEKTGRSTQYSMVGRERELALLRSGLDDAGASRGRVFLISGEPGVGKTRLADEVASAAQAKRMALMIGHCSEYDEAVAYLPFVEILENFVDRAPSLESLRTALGAQGSELARLLPKLRSILPQLPPALDLPPAQARRHLFNSFFEFAGRIASEQPTLIILEDLHWADDSTLSLLDHLTQRLADLALMVIGTHRDAELNVTRGLARTLEMLLRGRLATRVKLNRLPHNEVAAMLKSLTGKSPPASMVNEIHAETEGNPFFVEELFHHLEEENRLYDSAGQFRSELKIGELEAPPTVRLVVARRLTRLGGLTQKALATAAVIGRFFNFELLQASRTADTNSLLECIEEAEKAGLIFAVAESRRVRFGFSHELIRQGVIGALSAARRQQLHLEVADALERTYSGPLESSLSESLDDHVPELAQHYARGGNPAKAVEYYLRAVQRFADLGSNAEALAHFESGLEQMQNLPADDRRAELELDLRNAGFGALGDRKGFGSLAVEESCARAVVLCRRPGTNWVKVWTALYGMFFVHQLRPNVREAEAIAADLMAQAEGHGRVENLAEAENWSAYTRMVSGDFELAALGLDRAWARLESMATPATNLTPPRAVQIPDRRMIWQWGTRQNNRILSGWNLWLLGYPDRALERMNVATSIAQSGPRDMLADTHGFASYIHELRGEPVLMRARAEARLELSTESNFFTGRALSEIYLGWADAIAGDLEGGIARMRRHMLELKAAGSEYISDRCRAFIAIALARLKRFDEGLRTIDESFQFIARTGQHYYEAELHRLKGELLLAGEASNAAQAEKSFRTAIELAHKQRAKSWELRATTSLARLLVKRRKRDQAHALLAEIYGWFTEGFDTADLTDAKALLDELTTRHQRHAGSQPNDN